ncbi:transglutaminase N-terminal domain-containing protein [Turicimonas muris]|nr:transglutaminase N-terminal domain-containing protein [Turicimonas muris]
MKKFLYSLKTDLRFEEPVNNHTFLLRASPLAVPSQEPMRVSLSCSPACGLGIYKDAFGNLVHQGYLERGHDSFTFCSTGEVLIDVSKKDYSEPAPYYLFHTPLTRLEGVLAEYFLEFRTTGSADKVTD